MRIPQVRIFSLLLSTIQSIGYRCLAQVLVVPRALRDRYTQVTKVFAILYGSGAVLIHE